MDLKMCFNWKVAAGLGAIAVGILLFDPHLLAAALPVLLIAICPLSMLGMAWGMGHMGGMNGAGSGQGQQPGGPGQYTCPMHPAVRSDQPGRCPKCGMNLVPLPASAQTLAAPAGGPTLSAGQGDHLAQLQAQLEQVGEQQAALARQIERLQGPEVEVTAQSKAVQQAEEIARASEGRQ